MTANRAALLGPWTATAMVVSQVVGVGIFLTPATMMRSLGSPWAALAMWGVMGTLSAAGALCYAELSTRFPKAGGSYVALDPAHPEARLRWILEDIRPRLAVASRTMRS